VPGTNLFWKGTLQAETVFQVTDVTQDATNIYVHTSLAGGFPSVPLPGSGILSVVVHPAPKFNCSGCTGGGAAFANAPTDAPLFSYYQATFNPSTMTSGVGPGAKWILWGNFSLLSINVTSRFAGTGFLGFNPWRFRWVYMNSSKTLVDGWADMGVDTSILRNRVLTMAGETCNGVAGGCGGEGTSCEG
jgi:hypothetical protein